MRKPKVRNKFKLTIEKIKKLKITDRSQVHDPLFWRNDVIHAWCISESVGNEAMCDENEYWIGIYDENAPAYAGRFRISFSTYGGMCGYKFNEFFDEKDIDNEKDLLIQEKFLAQINKLIDLGILSF